MPPAPRTAWLFLRADAFRMTRARLFLEIATRLFANMCTRGHTLVFQLQVSQVSRGKDMAKVGRFARYFFGRVVVKSRKTREPSYVAERGPDGCVRGRFVDDPAMFFEDLEYRPGGVGYERARAHWASLGGGVEAVA